MERIVDPNYLKDVIPYVPASYNIKNKPWIDEWVEQHYTKLFNHFYRYEYARTIRCQTKADILHSTLLRFYTMRRKFRNKAECFDFLNNHFHINVKKPDVHKAD